jgi:hypothetical protein
MQDRLKDQLTKSPLLVSRFGSEGAYIVQPESGHCT